MTAPALSAAVGARDTLFYINDTSTLIQDAVYTIGSEKVKVTYVRDGRIGVRRGVGHSTAAAHVSTTTLTQAGNMELAQLPATAQAVDASGVYVVAPFAGTVVSAKVIPAATLTGANTDYRSVEVRNRGTGSGTTLVASKDYTNGVNGAADTIQALTLSAVAHATEVADGDVLELLSIHAGAGLAGPAFGVEIVFAPAE